MQRTGSAEIGQEGERLAVEWLRAHGYMILERNWRSGRYETDIIALNGDIVHFVEVRTRSVRGLLSPEETVTPDKCRSLFRCASAYLATYGRGLEPQFDLIAVDMFPDGGYDIRYVENAMQSHW
ncbi:MAG: YraN family protein [Alistipes sp.]|nr:YraN family protein [Alistipes sp.]